MSLSKLGEMSGRCGDTRSTGDKEASVEVREGNAFSVWPLDEYLDLFDAVAGQLRGQLLREAAVTTDNELEGGVVLLGMLVVPSLAEGGRGVEGELLLIRR